MILRVPVSRLYPLILVTALMLWYWERQLHPLPVPPQRSPRMGAKTRLLILSTWRSGSTFVGQLFSQNPEVFYLMEPIWYIWMHESHKTPLLMHEPARDLLKSLFLCDISALKPYLEEANFLSDIFMFYESRALCSPPACNAFQRSDIVDRVKCLKDCGQVLFTKIEEACKTYSHIVMKTVRFLDLNVLYPLLRDPSLNLTIIHLVRDPRAIFSSRQYLNLNRSNEIISKGRNSEANVSLVMQEVCKAQVRIYNASRASPPPFPRDRYHLVRFEDLAKDPLAYLKAWYQILGLSMSSKLESWVHNISQQESPVDEVVLPIRRDSRKVSQAWRENLSFQKVKDIQNLCKQDMEVFGYQLVWSEEEQKDMLRELVVPQKGFQEGY
ncbi:carbohydrate sulfotransferase 6-like [Rhinatrema bivittatum]|uniref:carbohydrate sulfotransferase 6-like n=1 Tax=Rhinatrema bivittatum TaxID=194408 RepID=UPI00112B483F|nr:carbohydrate sulfotransferase 6-like [Rhinatrema bivittatum]